MIKLKDLLTEEITEASAMKKRTDFGYDYTDPAGDVWHVWKDEYQAQWSAIRKRDDKGIHRESRKALVRDISRMKS